MTDKELLELSAKAAGIKAHWQELDLDRDESFVYYEDCANGLTRVVSWNPLTDDGDAFRLQVKLSMEIYRERLDFDGNQMSVSATANQFIGEEVHSTMGYSIVEATRRAIVRAAAEVGKEMLTHDEFVAMFPDRFQG